MCSMFAIYDVLSYTSNKQVKCFTCSWLGRRACHPFQALTMICFLVTTFPAVLNRCSDDELVALMHRYFLLSLDRAGYDTALAFHQSRGSSVESCWEPVGTCLPLCSL